MHVITVQALKSFWSVYPDAETWLKVWNKTIKASNFASFAELRKVYPSADLVAHHFVVFNVRGNKYRLITAIHFNRQRVYVRGVMTHAKYSRWRPPK